MELIELVVVGLTSLIVVGFFLLEPHIFEPDYGLRDKMFPNGCSRAYCFGESIKLTLKEVKEILRLFQGVADEDKRNYRAIKEFGVNDSGKHVWALYHEAYTFSNGKDFQGKTIWTEIREISNITLEMVKEGFPEEYNQILGD